jgi:hypothetical protein
VLQAALTAVALGQLDQLKALPGGPQGLLDLIKDCPIVAEVKATAFVDIIIAASARAVHCIQ